METRRVIYNVLRYATLGGVGKVGVIQEPTGYSDQCVFVDDNGRIGMVPPSALKPLLNRSP